MLDIDINVVLQFFCLFIIHVTELYKSGADSDSRYNNISQNSDGTHLAPFIIKAYSNIQENVFVR
jgi:hypothetical protein